MYNVFVGAAVTGTSYTLTRVMVAYSRKWQLIDVPNARSSHVNPTPRGGGVAIVLSSLIAIQLCAAAGLLTWSLATALCIAGGLVAGIGFWDDRKSLTPSVRFLGQLLAATILVAIIGVPRVFGPAVLMAGISVLTVTWLINLTNFMDGIDGLAAMECVFVLMTRATLPVFGHESAVVTACFIVAAAGLGFLLLNWSPAKIFMGDAGSGFIGFACSALILADIVHEPSRLWPWLILLGAFLADSGVTLLRRFVAGEKVWQAHRSHAYQHAAARWGHARTTTAFVCINAFWLTPLAMTAQVIPAHGFVIFLGAIAPLIGIAIYLGAGTDGKAAGPRSLFEALTKGLLERPRVHAGTKCLLHTALAAAAGMMAFCLRFDFAVPQSIRSAMLVAVAMWAVAQLLAVRLVGGLCSWRFFSAHDLVRLTAANLAASFLTAALLTGLYSNRFPISVLVLQFILSVALGASVRAAIRVTFDSLARSKSTERQRTLVYGAGRAGVLLLQEARKNGSFPYIICGFVDDQKPKGLLIQGTRVFGTGRDLKRLVEQHRISQILIAVPSGSREEMLRITECCRNAGVAFRTMPGISEILMDRPVTEQIREVKVEDVLGRNPVHLDSEGIRTKLSGKVVLVTGAAGSIGSELCRQVARFGPSMLVGFDISETALFFLEREMQRNFPDVVFCPEIGSIQNSQRLRDVFGHYRPKAVFHAAAFKHVPLMEKHMFEAVENNVFGTYNVSTVAAEFNVDDFVMISTDKAVRPTNVMGATKRTAELLIRSLQKNGPRYVSVRFGNVLGSNGSVLPIFKQQIAAGGPLTVTHPDIERYFMTIPEAAQLVLQACSMGSGGEIFVLDMGQPVKIVDLARQFIRLSGFEPDRDVQITFTGLRPGEKMYEELNLNDENTLPTHHEKIKVFAGKTLPANEIAYHLRQLRNACGERDADRLLQTLKALIPDYRESAAIRERVFTHDLANLGQALRFNTVAAAAESREAQV